MLPKGDAPRGGTNDALHHLHKNLGFGGSCHRPESRPELHPSSTDGDRAVARALSRYRRRPWAFSPQTQPGRRELAGPFLSCNPVRSNER
jgi:hypothetical protein